MDRRPETDRPPSTDQDAASWYLHRWDQATSFAAALLGDRVEAEDVASEVLLRVWDRWQVAGAPDRPDAYLRRAIRNEVATRFRRRTVERRAFALVAAAGAAPSPSGGDPESRAVDRAEVEWLLGRLPAAERDTVVSYYLDDRSCADIATASGLAAASVRSRLHRGRRAMAAVTG
jgi:RNA polymerase sigma-70 factor (ECF subfamily)